MATAIAGALASGVMSLQQEYTATRDAALNRAIFYDAGGLRAGADVVEKGAVVGEMSRVELFNGDALVVFSIDGGAHLGATTTATRPSSGAPGSVHDLASTSEDGPAVAAIYEEATALMRELAGTPSHDTLACCSVPSAFNATVACECLSAKVA